MPSATEDELLTTAEVAEQFRVTTSTVTRWAIDGKVPVVRVGDRFIRFRRKDVIALLTPTNITVEDDAVAS